jgi:signal transduction histidine kinase
VYIILPGFSNIEEKEAQQNVTHALNIVNYIIANLKGKANDWAAWDDTYKYAQDQNIAYVQNNLIDSTFANMQIDLMLLTNSTGDIIYCQSFDLANNCKVQTPEAAMEALRSDSLLWNFSKVIDKTEGFVMIDGQPMIVVSVPILTSQNEGPVMGALLFGKIANSEECNQISTLTDKPVSIYSVDMLASNRSQLLHSMLLDSGKVVLQKTSQNAISAFALMNDVHSTPSVVLQVDLNRQVYQQGLSVFYLFLAASLALSILLGAGVMFLLKRSVVDPLNKLASFVRTMPAGSNGQMSVPKFGTDETTLLANAFEDSMDQRLEAMNEVSRMVGHDLRNPLTGIKGAAYILKKNYGATLDEKGSAQIKVINDCVEYSDKIVKDLLEYSCKINLEKTKTNPRSLIDGALATLVVPGNISVMNEVGDDSTLMVDTGRMQRVFGNLIKNACDAMPDGGELKISSREVNRQTAFAFSDTGVGMSEDTLKKLWAPFFTTKAKGMGVGLSICKKIVEAHSGTIEVKSTLRKGTTFTVFLPTEKS